MVGADFDQLNLITITKRITFPSVLDYVRFQLIATPMSGLSGDRSSAERETMIRARVRKPIR
jgi:hypothetical protein